MEIGFVTWTSSAPTGGNIYNARLIRVLERQGHGLRRLEIPGAWPAPDPGGRARLAVALGTARTLVVDGVVGSAAPAEVEAPVGAGRFVALLVHLPIVDEVGLDPATFDLYRAVEHRSVAAASTVL